MISKKIRFRIKNLVSYSEAEILLKITNGAYCGFCTMLGLASISDCGIGRAIRGSLGWIVSAFNVFSVLKCHPPLRTIGCLFRR